MATVLRRACRTDIDGMHRIRLAVKENRLVSTAISESDYITAIETNGRGCVVECDGTIVAFAIGNSRTGNIWALFVDPAHERRGYGRKLLNEMVNWLWSEGLELLWLTTSPTTRAQHFYESAGWRNVGRTAQGELRFELEGPPARRQTTAITWCIAAWFAVACLPAFASTPHVVLKHLKGGVYLVEDSYYAPENSAVYIGPKTVTVIGATWTPDTAERLAAEIRKVTSKPISEVIVPDYHPDRSGGSAYFRRIGARIVSTRMTYDILLREWEDTVAQTRKSSPSYPALPLVLPDRTYPGSYELQDGRVRAIYLGPAHTPDGVFVYFPNEKILFGNCILKEFLGNLASADLDEYPKTLQKLKDRNLGFTTIIAGHGSPLHGPELIDRFLQLLKEHNSRDKIRRLPGRSPKGAGAAKGELREGQIHPLRDRERRSRPVNAVPCAI